MNKPPKQPSRYEQQREIESLFLSEEEKQQLAEKGETLSQQFKRWRLVHPVATWVIGIAVFVPLIWLLGAGDEFDSTTFRVR